MTPLRCWGNSPHFSLPQPQSYKKNHLNNKDLLLKPDISGLSTTDWNILPEALQKGIDIAEKNILAIKTLSIDETRYKDYQHAKDRRHEALLIRASAPIDKLQIINQSDAHTELIHEKLQLQEGSTLSAKDVNNAVEKLYAIDQFQRVDAQVISIDAENILQVIPQRKSWGPNYLSFGLGWESELSTSSNLDFNIAYTKSNITKFGGEWRSIAELGTEHGLATELYLPLDSKQRFFSRSRYLYQSFEWEIYNRNKPFLEVYQKEHDLEQGLGWNFTQAGAVELGISAAIGEYENELIFNGDLAYKSHGLYLKMGYDTLDSISFPTRGHFLQASLYGSKENVNNDNNQAFVKDAQRVNSLFLEINWKSVINLNNHAIVGKLSYAEVFTRNGNDSLYFTSLGGFLNLSGFHKNALLGSQKVFASAMYQYDLGRSLLRTQQYPIYAGVSLETGYAGYQIDRDDLIAAGSLFLGTETQLGPIALGLGTNSANQQAIYFYLGKNL